MKKKKRDKSEMTMIWITKETRAKLKQKASQENKSIIEYLEEHI